MKRRSFLQSMAVPPWLPGSEVPPNPALRKRGAKPLLAEGGVKPLTMGIDHVLMEIGDALAARKPPASTPELEQRKNQVREALLGSLGLSPFPERTPLNARLVGRLHRRGYAIEKLVFESRPNFFVPAHLYVPESLRERAPAVVCPTGHWIKTGKEDPTHVQPRCIGLARRGYLVMAYDPIGQGERLVPGNHHSLGFTSFLLGSCNMGWMVWDSMRAVDYLLTRPDVDPEKIGITGASGGGANTFYTAAVDERIRAAVPVVFVCTFLDWFRYGGDNCICDHLPGFMARFEEHDLFSLIAPRPMLILNSYPDDGYPVSGARVTFAAARQIYGLLGAREHVDYRELPTPHGYLRPEREAMYGWFDYYLQGKGNREPRPEEPFEVEPASSTALRCFAPSPPPTARTMVEFNRETYEEIRRRWSSPPRVALREQLIAALGNFPIRTPLYAQDRTPRHVRQGDTKAIVFRSETGIVLPSLLFAPQPPVRNSLVIYLSPRGKQAACENALRVSLTGAGFHVMAVDLRGMGETGRRPGTTGYPDEFKCCTDSAAQGKPILGQRVWDVIRTLDYVQEDPETRSCRVLAYGEGVCANIALFAAAVDERIKAVATLGALLSYRPAMQEIHDTVSLYDNVTSELVTAQARIHYSLFIPGLLKLADLPELWTLIGPRHVLALNPLAPDDYAEIRSKFAGLTVRENLPLPHVPEQVTDWLKTTA